MIPPINCPYKSLTAPPCWSCPRYNADMDSCALASLAATAQTSAADRASYTASAQIYADRLRQYEHDRKELLKLSKEALVDLILHRPTMY